MEQRRTAKCNQLRGVFSTTWPSHTFGCNRPCPLGFGGTPDINMPTLSRVKALVMCCGHLALIRRSVWYHITRVIRHTSQMRVHFKACKAVGSIWRYQQTSHPSSASLRARSSLTTQCIGGRTATAAAPSVSSVALAISQLRSAQGNVYTLQDRSTVLPMHERTEQVMPTMVGH